ncbi:hypothetical protein AB0C77_36455 [Streptomyces sp. NPDC048629]|uniref:hypothetical protein n=1 Tax=Streptomyces sp. NPDC048629 TaxID=3154824 RepID=UPI00344A9F3D
MTAAAVVPPAVPRPARGTALRRVLGTLVFLGGLLLLAVAYGGRAEAAELPPAATAETGRLVDRSAGTADEPLRAVEHVAATATATSTATAVEPVVRPVTNTVRETVRRVAGAPVVRDIVEPVHEAVHLAVQDARDRVPLPAAESVPAAPSVPSDGATFEQLATVLATSAASPADVAEATVVHVPAADPLPVVVREFRRAHARTEAPATARPALPAHAPVPGRPCGAPAVGQASAPRGGDQQDATLTPGTPCAGPVRGATLPATAAVLLDRTDDVLEFPG